MPRDTVFASELTWPDYDAAVKTGQTPILIPIGSMEQHGPHLPLDTDAILVRRFVDPKDAPFFEVQLPARDCATPPADVPAQP